MTQNGPDPTRPPGKLQALLPDVLFEGDQGFLGRFLAALESMWVPLERQAEDLPWVVDPRYTPERFLPWLGGRLGIPFDPELTVAQRRELLWRSAWLRERQGTAAALRESLRIQLGVPADRIEIAGPDGSDGSPFGWFGVTILDDPASSDSAGERLRERARRIIDREKPAHTSFKVDVRR